MRQVEIAISKQKSLVEKRIKEVLDYMESRDSEKGDVV